MTTLHDRLADLADSAPKAEPASGLWERGRRWHRRRRAGTVLGVAVACLVLIALAGVGWQRSQPPEQLHPAGAPAGLPDRIFAPSPWLPGTDDEGPLGRLAMLLHAERKSWSGTSAGTVGISATTGEYRFLDLPDSAGEESALSPDGNRVAYWVTGSTTESPNLREDVEPVVGVAVWDARTGKVDRRLVPTEHGLAPSFLAWADSQRLLVEAGHYRGGEDDSEMDQSSGTFGDFTVWDVGAGGDLKPVAGVPPGSGSSVSPVGAGRLVVHIGGRRYQLYDLDDGVQAEFRVRGHLSAQLVVDPSGGRVAGIWGGANSRNPNDVVVGPLSPNVTLRKVPGSGRTFRVLTWLDSDRVVTERRTGSLQEAVLGVSLFVHDVRTGESDELVRLRGLEDVNGATEYATQLFEAPTVDAVQPPSPPDPRVVAGLAIGAVVIAVGAVVAWRRRVRA